MFPFAPLEAAPRGRDWWVSRDPQGFPMISEFGNAGEPEFRVTLCLPLPARPSEVSTHS